MVVWEGRRSTEQELKTGLEDHLARRSPCVVLGLRSTRGEGPAATSADREGEYRGPGLRESTVMIAPRVPLAERRMGAAAAGHCPHQDGVEIYVLRPGQCDGGVGWSG